jgi:hypothetical protein
MPAATWAHVRVCEMGASILGVCVGAVFLQKLDFE